MVLSRGPQHAIRRPSSFQSLYGSRRVARNKGLEEFFELSSSPILGRKIRTRRSMARRRMNDAVIFLRLTEAKICDPEKALDRSKASGIDLPTHYLSSLPAGNLPFSPVISPSIHCHQSCSAS